MIIGDFYDDEITCIRFKVTDRFSNSLFSIQCSMHSEKLLTIFPPLKRFFLDMLAT